MLQWDLRPDHVQLGSNLVVPATVNTQPRESVTQPGFGSACWTHSKANLLTPGCDKGEYSVYCRAPCKENGQLMLKRPKLPHGFEGRFGFFFVTTLHLLTQTPSLSLPHLHPALAITSLFSKTRSKLRFSLTSLPFANTLLGSVFFPSVSLS